MANIYALDGVIPVIDPTAFVHPEAVLIGDVIIGAGCYVAPFASLRGDFGRILIGAGANVQDSCTIHTFPGKTTVVEADGHIGHGAILHGCTVRTGALVGMNSVIMDGAIIDAYAFVGAGSFIKAGFEVPSRHLAAGNPARILRELSAKELAWKSEGTLFYQRLARRCIQGLKPAQALEKVEDNRPSVSWDKTAPAPLYEMK